MVNITTHLTRFRLHALLFLITFIALFSVIWFPNIDTLNPVCAEMSDYAANALRVEEAKQGTLLTGPYSQFGFAHLGPFHFYLRALTESLVPGAASPYGAHCAVQLALSLLLLLWAAMALCRATGKLYVGITFLIVTLWYLGVFEIESLAGTWGPHAVVIPMLTAAVATSAVSAGWTAALPLFIFSAGIAAHAHLGTVLPLGILGAITIVGALKSSTSRTIWALSFYTASLFALPIILDVISNPARSNLWRIIRFFLADHPTHSLVEAFNEVAVYYSRALGLASPILALSVSILVLLALPTHQLPILRKLRFSLGAATLVSIVSAKSVVGPLHWYLLRYTNAFVALTIFCLIVWLIEVVFQIIPARVRNYCITSAAILFLMYLPSQVRIPHNTICGSEPTELVKQLHPVNGTRYEIHHSGPERLDYWDSGTGFGLALARAGYSFCVDKSWGFLYGRSRICRKDLSVPRVSLTINGRSNWVGPIPPGALVTSDLVVIVKPVAVQGRPKNR